MKKFILIKEKIAYFVEKEMNKAVDVGYMLTSFTTDADGNIVVLMELPEPDPTMDRRLPPEDVSWVQVGPS